MQFYLRYFRWSLVLPKLKRHVTEKNTLSNQDSNPGHRKLNETDRSVIARYRNFNAPKICKITVSPSTKSHFSSITAKVKRRSQNLMGPQGPGFETRVIVVMQDHSSISTRRFNSLHAHCLRHHGENFQKKKKKKKKKNLNKIFKSHIQIMIQHVLCIAKKIPLKPGCHSGQSFLPLFIKMWYHLIQGHGQKKNEKQRPCRRNLAQGHKSTTTTIQCEVHKNAKTEVQGGGWVVEAIFVQKYATEKCTHMARASVLWSGWSPQKNHVSTQT